MDKKLFYDILINNLNTDAYVKEIIHGISWTAARLDNGSVGVAMHGFGDTAPRMFNSLEGLNVNDAAKAVMSWNFEEANEGMAVINACYNTIENLNKYGCEASQDSCSALSDINIENKKVGFIGHLVGKHSGLTEEILSTAKAYYIMEREPREGDLPDSACEYIIPECDIVVITGSASMNKTMPRLLELAEKATVVLTGPSVPMCPELLKLGINRLFGNVIVLPNELCDSIVVTKGSVNKFSKRFIINN